MSRSRIAAVVALLIGAVSVVAGGRALQGWDPGYSVLGWLPVYNVALGLWTVIVAALIWRGSRRATSASIGTVGVHTLVLLVLLSGLLGTPARESLLAMTFRVATWLVILALLRPASRAAMQGGGTSGSAQTAARGQ